jgi:hypothetical protein
MELPGQALAVALVVWQRAGWQRKRTVRLCLSGELPGGLNQWSARRGLVALERAGLIATVREPGRGVQVTILDAPATPERNGSG